MELQWQMHPMIWKQWQMKSVEMFRRMEFIIIVWRRDWFEQQMRAMNSVLVVMQILHCRKDTEYGKAYDETIICKRQAGCMHHRSSEPQKIWSGRYWWNTGKSKVDEIIKRNWITDLLHPHHYGGDFFLFRSVQL